MLTALFVVVMNPCGLRTRVPQAGKNVAAGSEGCSSKRRFPSGHEVKLRHCRHYLADGQFRFSINRVQHATISGSLRGPETTQLFLVILNDKLFFYLINITTSDYIHF